VVGLKFTSIIIVRHWQKLTTSDEFIQPESTWTVKQITIDLHK